MALPMTNTWAVAGAYGPPPGILKSLRSQGATQSPPPATQATAVRTTSSAGTTWCTRPSLSASSGLTDLPSSSKGSAFMAPTSRATRCVPPPPGNRPTLDSGRPSCSLSFAATTRWWQASASSNPPPSARPVIAAATGLPQVSSARNSLLMANTASNRAARPASVVTCGLAIRLPISPRSAPAQKPLALPEVITAPLIAASLRSRSTISPSSRITSAVSVFIERPGASKVTSATPCSSVARVKLFMGDARCGGC